MKRSFLYVGLLLPGLLAGCATDRDMQAIRYDALSLERQGMRREQELDERLQALNERVNQVDRSNSEARRELAKVTATSEELRSEIQRLHGAMQVNRYQGQPRSTPPGEVGRDPASVKPVEGDSRPSRGRDNLSGAQGSTAPSLTSLPGSMPTTPAAATSNGQAADTPGTGPSGTSSLPASPPQPPAQPTVASLPPPPAAPPQPPLSTRPSSPQPQAAAAPEGTDNASAERLYQRALKDQQQGNYEVSMVLYKQVQRQYPKSSYAAQAQYGIGESLYAQKQYEAAIVAFDEVIQKYPQNTKIPAAILKQGLAFAELKDQRNARFFLQQVQKKYPHSPEAQQAAEKLKQLH